MALREFVCPSQRKIKFYAAIYWNIGMLEYWKNGKKPAELPDKLENMV